MKSIQKRLTAIIWFILAFIIAFTVAGCSGKNLDEGYLKPGGDWIAGDALAPSGSSSAGSAHAPDGSYGEEGTKNPNNPQTPITKQLTAAAWSDAINYDFWLKLFEKSVMPIEPEDEEQVTRDGIFSSYATATRGLNSLNMHEVYVTCGESPVVGATVKLYGENNLLYSAVTDSAGKAYVFGSGTRLEAVSGQFSTSGAVTENGVTNIDLTDFKAVENELEIMLVVDTTGSMGDELSFLCDELAGVVTRVSSALKCNIRLGLLFYRDRGDDYVTRKFGFTEVTSSKGLNTVVKNIKAQKSEGGGDYPEAVDTALSEAVAADWHTSSKTRLLFHVLDAPYHDEQQNQTTFANAVKSAAQKGIRIIPVAASGLDTLGQYTMRSAALLTGGTYAFLTDDSGIGDHHELPAVGEYTVEYLSDLMVRLIKGYYTGTFDTPIPWTQSESVA